MLREDYHKELKKIKLTKNQEEVLSNHLDQAMALNIPLEEDLMAVYDGFVSTFNNLYFFIIGDGDCKDMFTDDYEMNYVSVSILTGDYSATNLDSIINLKVNELVSILKKELSNEQIKRLIESLNSLYVTYLQIIEKKTYEKNRYQLGAYKTQKEILVKLGMLINLEDF